MLKITQKTKINQDNLKLLKKVLKIFKPYRFKFFGAILLLIASIVASTISPKILWEMIDVVVADLSTQRSINYQLISDIFLGLFALYVGRIICGFFSNVLLAKISASFTSDLRIRIFEKINRMPIKFFNDKKTGEILTVITDDTSTIGEDMGRILSQALEQIIEVTAIFGFMLAISWQLTIAVVLSSIVIVFVSKFVNKKLNNTLQIRRKYRGKINSDIEEFYTSQVIVHSNAQDVKVLKHIDKKMQHFIKYSSDAFFITRILPSVIVPSISFISSTLIWVIGGWMTINGRFSFGHLQTMNQYSWRIMNPITSLATISTNLQEIIVAAKRIFDLLEVDEEPNPPVSQNLPQSIRGEVIFDHVCFNYEPNQPVIKDFSLKVEPGMKVAIVGPTGAGKTTLVNLLMRFFDYDSGEIFIDGVPISQVPRSQVRKAFSMVLQETWLSSDTIYNNLTYGNSNVSKDEVKKIAKLSNVEHIIEAMPESYKTTISEDLDNISAGEKQLLTIARAMITDSPMLILDEATSNVDTRTERLIQDAMAKLMKNRTTFVIAHRLSTIIDADIILVLKDGEVVEQGTHQELITRNGFYKNLYNSQFEEDLE